MSSELVHGIYWDRCGADWTSNNTAWCYEVWEDRYGYWRWKSRGAPSHDSRGTASTRDDAMLHALRHYVSQLHAHADKVESGLEGGE